jgi:hypothetical protein
MKAKSRIGLPEHSGEPGKGGKRKLQRKTKMLLAVAITILVLVLALLLTRKDR